MNPDQNLPDLLPSVADMADAVMELDDELEPTPFGEMPREKEEVEINGVKCVVKRVMSRGRILLKII